MLCGVWLLHDRPSRERKAVAVEEQARREARDRVSTLQAEVGGSGGGGGPLSGCVVRLLLLLPVLHEP